MIYWARESESGGTWWCLCSRALRNLVKFPKAVNLSSISAAFYIGYDLVYWLFNLIYKTCLTMCTLMLKLLHLGIPLEWQMGIVCRYFRTAGRQKWSQARCSERASAQSARLKTFSRAWGSKYVPIIQIWLERRLINP